MTNRDFELRSRKEIQTALLIDYFCGAMSKILLSGIEQILLKANSSPGHESASA